MAFSLSHIVNKFIPTKRIDDDLRENPFNTAVGQEVVSVEENFWSRKVRYGRSAFKLIDGVSCGNAGTLTSVGAFNADTDKILIPDIITFSANVDCALYVSSKYASNYDSYNAGLGEDYIACAYVSAGQPFILTLDGSVEIVGSTYSPGSTPYGGSINIRVIPTTSGGKAYGCIHGVEVALRA